MLPAMISRASILLAHWHASNCVPYVRLAAACGVSAPAYHDWLHGQRRPRPAHRATLEALTRVPAAAWDIAAGPDGATDAAAPTSGNPPQGPEAA